MHPRVQRLDPAVHHLRESGDLRHIEDGEPGGAQRRGRAAGREEFDAERRKRARKIGEAALVGNRDERPPDPDDIRGHWRSPRPELSNCAVQ